MDSDDTVKALIDFLYMCVPQTGKLPRKLILLFAIPKVSV